MRVVTPLCPLPYLGRHVLERLVVRARHGVELIEVEPARDAAVDHEDRAIDHRRDRQEREDLGRGGGGGGGEEGQRGEAPRHAGRAGRETPHLRGWGALSHAPRVAAR